MSIKYTDHFNTKQTSVTQAIPGSGQVVNADGAYVWQVSKWDRLNRFLILGSEGGSYYKDEKKLTVDNAESILDCIQEDGLRVLKTIVDISDAGRAPKNDPAIFALALVCSFGDDKVKQAGYAAITKVCRIGTHLYSFCEAIQQLRGWSRGLRKGVAKFYTNRTADQVAMQLMKYRQRNGWTHKDVLRLAHPSSTNAEVNQLLRYAVGKPVEGALHPLLAAFEEIQTLDITNAKRAQELIREYRLPREALPTQLLNDKGIWEALLEDMPMTAMIRNLGKMTSIGLLDKSMSEHVKKVTSQLHDVEKLKAARVHPLSILVAAKTYESGHGDKGDLAWTPSTKIVDALNDAFYLAFQAIEPTNKNMMLSLDCSASMTWQKIAGMPITPREASAALSLVTAATEENHEIMGFSTGLVDLNISPKQRLDDVIKAIGKVRAGSTNLSMPMLYALEKKIPVDTFVIYTDNELNTGTMHPKQALDKYRQAMGKDTKVVICAMTASEFTIADPKDTSMVDIAGFDAACPQIIAEFSR